MSFVQTKFMFASFLPLQLFYALHIFPTAVVVVALLEGEITKVHQEAVGGSHCLLVARCLMVGLYVCLYARLSVCLSVCLWGWKVNLAAGGCCIFVCVIDSGESLFSKGVWLINIIEQFYNMQLLFRIFFHLFFGFEIDRQWSKANNCEIKWNQFMACLTGCLLLWAYGNVDAVYDAVEWSEME